MGSAARSTPHRGCRLPARRVAVAALGALALCSIGASALARPAAATLPDPVRTSQRTLTIPFQLPATQDPDADAAVARILLQVSKDLGGTWMPAGESAPSASAFTFTADADGEYWFRLRAVDRKGRMRGGEGPDMRVLVDAAAPRLAARVWKGADGEIACRYAAADDSIDLTSLKVEYRVGTGEWKTVATEGILVRQSPAHVVGEDIWWAGEKVESLAVRIAVADAAGNRTAKQFTMEASDPGIDQTALATEVGVTPLPMQDNPAPPVTPAPAAGLAAAPPPAAPTVPGTWRSESATWPGGDAAANAGSGRDVLMKNTAVAADAPWPPASTVDGSRLAPAAVPAPAADGSLEYRGRRLQFSRSRRFAWDYELPAEAAAGQQVRAELWSTRDGGVTWQRAAVDTDGVSPIDVEMPAAGLYGFRIETVAPNVGTAGPRSGDEPDTWLGIDEEPPHVELLGVTHDGDALVIRWTARDPLLQPRGVRIVYAMHAEGPWATIVAGAENQGEHRWQPDRSVPAKVFVRIEATDAAGNMAAATTPEAITISQSRFVGKLGGLRPLPPPAP